MSAFEARPEVLDLTAAAAIEGSGAILSRESDDLDLNLVRFGAGGGVAAHVNHEVDVLVVALDGSGEITVNGESCSLSPGKALVIPKGTERVIRNMGEEAFVYLSIHRRRRGLMPSPRSAHRT